MNRLKTIRQVKQKTLNPTQGTIAIPHQVWGTTTGFLMPSETARTPHSEEGVQGGRMYSHAMDLTAPPKGPKSNPYYFRSELPPQGAPESPPPRPAAGASPTWPPTPSCDG